jgi:phosphohistidine phosphatase
MKTLLVLRHGKSDWNAEHGEDHDRPLARRGRKAAQRMGRFLSSLGQEPDLVLSSSATRARETAELAMAAGDWTCPLDSTWELYAATVPATLKIIQSQDDQINNLMLVGHQPTWSELVAHLMGGGGLRFPTAALARIDFDASSWQEIEPGAGSLVWFVIPRLLKSAALAPESD